MSRNQTVTTVTVPINPDPFILRWLVPEQGFEWVEGLSDSEPRLVMSLGPKSGGWVYSPLKQRNLFMRFASLKPRRTGIQRFANRYGDLFDGYELSAETAVRRPRGSYHFAQLHGASLRRWKFEIERMRVLVHIWEAIKRNRTNVLGRVVIWKRDDRVEYRIGQPLGLPPATGILASKDVNPMVLARFKPLDVLKPAQYMLQRKINDQLATLKIAPRLVWCPGPRINGMAKPDYYQRITFQPSNLLGAMWLQFAQAITSEKYRIQTCQGCGRNFHVGPGAKRAHSITCGEARCRQRVSRERRRLAGKSLL